MLSEKVAASNSSNFHLPGKELYCGSIRSTQVFRGFYVANRKNGAPSSGNIWAFAGAISGGSSGSARGRIVGGWRESRGRWEAYFRHSRCRGISQEPRLHRSKRQLRARINFFRPGAAHQMREKVLRHKKRAGKLAESRGKAGAMRIVGHVGRGAAG